MTTGIQDAEWLDAKVVELSAENKRLREIMEQIRGFVAVMGESNWRDMRLHIERQCSVIEKATGK